MNKAPRNKYFQITYEILAGALILAIIGLMAFFATKASAAPRPPRAGVTTPSTAEKLADSQLHYSECVDMLALAPNPSTMRINAQQCIHDYGILIQSYQRTPTPSPSRTPTPSPSASATPLPSPTVTTASPTPSPTTPAPSSTPTLTVGPTPPMFTDCIAAPSRCGYPDATNTGVQAGHTLEVRNGTVHVPAGVTVHDLEIHGDVVFDGNNGGLDNVRLIQENPDYGMRAFGDLTGLHIDHTEINQNGRLQGKGIAFNGYTMTNTYIHGGADCAHFSAHVAIRHTACYLGPDNATSLDWCDQSHIDGFQTDGGFDIVLDGNTIVNPCAQTGAIIIDTDLDPNGVSDDIHIRNNLVSGGGYTIYCNARARIPSPTVELIGNRFARNLYANGGFWGNTANCGTVPNRSGNVWDDTNESAPTNTVATFNTLIPN
jgi:hypothetical protein